MGRQNNRPGRWLNDLYSLSAQGLSDRQIALRLGRLYPAQRFSRAVVWHWRTQDARLSPRKRRPRPAGWRAEHRQERDALYQVQQGFGFLLPRELRWPEKGFGPGIRLRRREVDILCALRDLGSQTARELRALFGLTTLQAGRTHWLSHLMRKGLVEVRGTICMRRGRPQRVYGLTDNARPDARPRLQTGVEKRYG